MLHSNVHSNSQGNGLALRVDRWLFAISRNWILLFVFFFGLYIGLPFLAPVLMQIGLPGAGRVIYAIYSTQCHQLPERSFFLFGPQFMYPLGQVQAAWKNTFDPLVLRQFIGNASMGWKVAWSDRMVYMYGSTLFFGLLWWPLRRRVPELPWWGFALFLLPMALDGGSHMLGEILGGGIGHGFRSDNAWLAALTHNAFPASFYAGDALGSFNSWMRLLTGVFFGMGVVWFGFPYLDATFNDFAETVKYRLQKAGVRS